MTRLLHISASPRGAASESLQIAEQFLDAVRDVRPDVEIDTFDLCWRARAAFSQPPVRTAQ